MDTVGSMEVLTQGELQLSSGYLRIPAMEMFWEAAFYTWAIGSFIGFQIVYFLDRRKETGRSAQVGQKPHGSKP